MDAVSSFDIHNVDDADFGPPEESVAGYLDDVLSTFERHQHPFLLVGVLAMKWSGSNPAASREIDILVQDAKIESIASELVASGEWAVSPNPYTLHQYVVDSYVNKTSIPDIWLMSRNERFSKNCFHLNYLRLWPEALYKLSVAECQKVEVPDLLTTSMVLLEEEYYRDPHNRFGPLRRSVLQAYSEKIIFSPRGRCKRKRRDIPIFIPTIEHHLQALFDQDREEKKTKLGCGNFPIWHVENLIRYHVWDWPPASAWLLANKIRECDYENMKRLLERYVRKPICIFDRTLQTVKYMMPWDQAPKPQLPAPKESKPEVEG